MNLLLKNLKNGKERNYVIGLLGVALQVKYPTWNLAVEGFNTCSLLVMLPKGVQVVTLFR